MIRRKVRLQRE